MEVAHGDGFHTICIYMLYSKVLLGPSKWKYAKMHISWSYLFIVYLKIDSVHRHTIYIYSSELFRIRCTQKNHKHDNMYKLELDHQNNIKKIVVLSWSCLQGPCTLTLWVAHKSLTNPWQTNFASVHILLPRRVQLNHLLQILEMWHHKAHQGRVFFDKMM